MEQEMKEFHAGEEEKVLVDDQCLRDIDVFPESTKAAYQNEVTKQITTQEISDFGNEGFLLRNVLTAEECTFYINEGERIGFEEMPGVQKTFRNNLRVIVKNQDLVELLFSRIRPYLKDIEISGDPHKVHIHGIESLLQGCWTPVRLNPMLRLCRYKAGGHFSPHFDGHYVHNIEERSLTTFMLYLNGDFEGGSTNFVDEQQTLYMGEDGHYCAEEKNILCGIQPEAGLAIIFNHHRLHEGEALRNGVKYILRTDVMYRKVGGEPNDPHEEQALQMVQEAERLEARGKNMEAMQLYRKAFKISPSIAAAYGN